MHTKEAFDLPNYTPVGDHDGNEPIRQLKVGHRAMRKPLMGRSLWNEIFGHTTIIMIYPSQTFMLPEFSVPEAVSETRDETKQKHHPQLSIYIKGA